jgi:hypothetical protein
MAQNVAAQAIKATTVLEPSGTAEKYGGASTAEKYKEATRC